MLPRMYRKRSAREAGRLFTHPRLGRPFEPGDRYVPIVTFLFISSSCS